MTVNTWARKKRTKIAIYFYVVLVLLLLLTVSSYTWFARSRLNRVSNMSIYVNTPMGLEISTDVSGTEWGQQISYIDMMNEVAPLRPVTYSDENDSFFAAVYDIDGRLTGKWLPLSDERNANRNNYEGYYVIATFFARSDERANVSLAPAVAVDGGEDGSGTYLIGVVEWDAEKLSHWNVGEGAENAVRVGIKVTRLDENNAPTEEEPIFYIYEPNCNKHYDGSYGYVNTPSIDGTDSLIPSGNIIKQTATVWEESDPVERDKQIFYFGEFLTPVDLFTIDKNEVVMIQLYIWLEGQDMDCNNSIKEAQIMANIQFLATTDPHSGMQPIE